MNIYRDEENERICRNNERQHPWQISLTDPKAKYYDFIQQPELIKDVLEDFMPFEQYQAIQTFYDLIYFVNGKTSVFESDDCWLVFGERSSETNDLIKQQNFEIEGRLMVFWREHFVNTKPECLWLYAELWNEILEIDKEFSLGCIAFYTCPSKYLSISQPWSGHGVELVIRFWSWGMTKDETFANLDRLFNNLLEVFKKVSAKAKKERIIENTLANKLKDEQNPENFI
jgi:hypothetical protein